MGNSKSFISAVLKRECVTPDDIQLCDEYKGLTERLSVLIDELQLYNLDDPQREKIGLKIQKIQKRIAAIKEELASTSELVDRDVLTSAFRSAAGHSLTKRLYGEILHHANIMLSDPSYKPPIISLLTREENELIENGKKLKEERDMLKVKLIKAKKIIQDSMPNFLGNLSTNEYDKRLELTKILSKINKEL